MKGLIEDDPKLRLRLIGKLTKGLVARSNWYSDDAPLYALLVYGKSEKTNLTADEAKAVAALARAIKEEAQG
jgi:hypothetical protein